MHQVNQQKGQKTYKYIAKKINKKNVNEKPNRCLERDKKNRKTNDLKNLKVFQLLNFAESSMRFRKFIIFFKLHYSAN